MSNIEQILDMIGDEDVSIAIAEGLDDAIIGYEPISMRLVYSIDKCVEITAKSFNLSHEDALEYLELNTFCAYIGENTPIWIETV